MRVFRLTPYSPFAYLSTLFLALHTFSPTEQVDAFRVDGIPHLAMVNADGEVETAIIGTVPKDVSTGLFFRT